MKRFLLAALALALTAEAWAQQKADEKEKEHMLQAYAYVMDHLTHEKIPNLKGELLMAADSSFVDTLEVRDNLRGQIQVNAFVKKADRYILRIQAEGYVTAYLPMNIAKMHKKERYRQLQNVYLRRLPKKNDIELDEVVVKATKLKFYMDGDTLIYDADAFPMAEGSMLGDLIKQLPGVEVESGGVIKVNGKTVDAMLLNGKDFFDKDRELLLENMPSYTVKSFNAYERAPEQVRGTKREKSVPQEFVMDVRLKKEYSIGWIANAEAGGGATFFDNDKGSRDGKFLARLFGLRFTDKSRLTVFANANNLNDYRNPGNNGDWGQLTQSEGLTKSVKTGVNYAYDNYDNSQPERIKYEGSIDGTYSDKDDKNHTSSATFLDDGNTFGKSFWSKRSHDWQLNTRHKLTYGKDKVKDILKDLYLSLTPTLSYLKWDNTTASAAATLADDVAQQLGKQWMDSIMAPNAGYLLKQYAINRTRSSTHGTGHNLNTTGSLNVSANPAYDDLLDFYLVIYGGITDRCEDNYEHYTLDYPRDPSQATDYRNRYNPTTDKTQHLLLSPYMNIYFGKEERNRISLMYVYQYAHRYSNSPLYLLNQLSGWEQADSHQLGMLPSEEDLLAAMDRNNTSHSTSATHHIHRK